MLPGFFLNKLSSPPNVKLPPHSCCAPAEQRLADQLPKQKRLANMPSTPGVPTCSMSGERVPFGTAGSDTVDERMGSERLQSNDVVKQRTCTLLEHLLYSHLPDPRFLRRVVAKAGGALLHRCRTRRAGAHRGRHTAQRPGRIRYPTRSRA